jgi:acetoacetate decarboxylase
MVRYAAMHEEPVVSADPDGPKMWSKNVLALYETDPELVAAVLPRPLELTEPIVRVNYAQVDMPDGNPLSAGTVAVKCRDGDIVGSYDLLMIMNTDTAVVGGRETFGEPKKVGEASIRHEGDQVVAALSRRGVVLAEVRGRVVEQLPVEPRSERYAFYFKFLMDPAGGRFDGDPSLVHVRRTQEDRLRERIEGELILRDSPFDPIADLPVRRVLSITYTESNQTQSGQISRSVPSEWIWPYRHQRYDNMIARLQPARA